MHAQQSTSAALVLGSLPTCADGKENLSLELLKPSEHDGLISRDELAAAKEISGIIGDRILEEMKNEKCGEIPQITVQPLLDNFGVVAQVRIVYNSSVSSVIIPSSNISPKRPTCDEQTIKSEILLPSILKGRAGKRPQLINFKIFAFDKISLGSLILYVGIKRQSA